MSLKLALAALALGLAAGADADPDLDAVAKLSGESLAAYDARYRDATAKSLALKTVAAGRPCTIRHAPRGPNYLLFVDADRLADSLRVRSGSG